MSNSSFTFNKILIKKVNKNCYLILNVASLIELLICNI